MEPGAGRQGFSEVGVDVAPHARVVGARQLRQRRRRRAGQRERRHRAGGVVPAAGRGS